MTYLLVDAIQDMRFNGVSVSWTKETIEKVSAIVNRAKIALDSFEVICNKHFEDSRHAYGEENRIRSNKGYRFPGFFKKINDGHYDHTVSAVESGGDIVHNVCGTQLKLHDYFLEKMRTDSIFFEKVWCPSCLNYTTIRQWDVVSSL